MDTTIEPPDTGTQAGSSAGVNGGSSAAGPSLGNRNRDPLVYLQEFISAKKKVHFQDDWLDFDGHKIHRSAKCAYVPNKGGPLIDIGSVWYMFHATSADRNYTQASVSGLNFIYIGIDRRGDLCDFLLGRTNTCVGLVKEVWEGRKRPRERVPRMRSKAADSAREPTLGDTLSYEDVAKRVRSVQDLDVVIRRPGRQVPNANMILKIAEEEWHNLSNGIKEVAPVSSKAKGAIPLHVELEAMLRKNQKNNPIVLVPMNKNAPVNLLNVQDLLQQGTYQRPDDERAHFFESTRAESVEVKRNIAGKLWTFEVRDSVKNFSKEHWLRTVLVITDGNEWQFKNWPFETVVDLFQSIRGVYFQDMGKPLPQHVYNWPCKKLALPHVSAPHRFSQIRDDIFTDLEEFMNSTRPKKFSNTAKMGSGRRMVQMMGDVL
jgi:hypothetical protein